MRRLLPVICCLGLASCASAEYRDNAEQAKRDPRCLDQPSVPGQAPAPWCDPKGSTTIGDKKPPPVYFTRKSKDD